MYVDSLRGHHSTGLAWVGKDDVPDHFKKAVDGPDFLQLQTVKNVLDVGINKTVLMGHNRYATRGGVSSATAHPFEHGDITLCHNGTLTTQVGLPEHQSFSVDSENISYAFAVDGVEETIPKLQGAFALTWIDEAASTFNLVRNSERPLCIATNKSRSVVYYASERLMLEAILTRNGVTKADYLELPVGKWMSFKLDKGKVEVPHIRNVKLHVKPVYSYASGHTYQSSGQTTRVSNINPSSRILKKNNLSVGDDFAPQTHNCITRSHSSAFPVGKQGTSKKLLS